MIVIEPGIVRTKLVQTQIAVAAAAAVELTGEQAAIYRPLYEKYHAMIAKSAGTGISAEQCAHRIEAAAFARRPRTRYKVGLDSKLVTSLGWLCPDRVVDLMFRALQT